MASPRQLVTINLGSQTISVGNFEPRPNNGLALRGFRRRDVLGENAAEPARLAQVTVALREMLQELGLARVRVNYAVPAQSTFARFVKLPQVDEEKIERIIAFEAQQNVPFPIDEVVWDYQLVGGGDGEPLQVILVAIKSDLVESLNDAVVATGVRPSVVGVTTMALYNSFRFNYGELTGCSLLVDVGARTTNLIFVEPAKIFTRSVPLGGASITTAVAKEYNESFALAEKRKHEFVSTRATVSEIETATPIDKIVRNTVTRLHAEIMRSISHYRTQQNGSMPERIYLCGGAATPSLREYLQERFSVPIEFFDSLRNVTVDSAESKASAHALGELVGLALRSTMNCPMEVTLRPPSVVRQLEIERRRPFVVAAAACLILGLLGWSIYFGVAAGLLQKARTGVDEKVTRLKTSQHQLELLRKDIATIDAKAAPLLAAIDGRSFWPQLLEDLNARLPKENIWLTELVPLANGTPVTPDNAANVSEATPAAGPTAAPARTRSSDHAINGLLLRGLYLWNPRQQDVVTEYFKNLTGSKFLAIDPNNQARVMKPTMPNTSEWAFPYELRVDLRKPFPLP